MSRHIYKAFVNTQVKSSMFDWPSIQGQTTCGAIYYISQSTTLKLLLLISLILTTHQKTFCTSKSFAASISDAHWKATNTPTAAVRTFQHIGLKQNNKQLYQTLHLKLVYSVLPPKEDIFWWTNLKIPANGSLDVSLFICWICSENL